MKHYSLALTILLNFFCLEIAFGQSSLVSGFQNPPASAKAVMWWDWVNSNVSKEGITADLEAMKRVGVKAAEIFNVDVGFPEGKAFYLSPEWLNNVYFAASEAKRLDMEIGFHNGAGWSSSGGPWVTPENAMQTVVYSETKISGGEKLNISLPQPPTKFGYYKDIAVLAFPTPKSDIRIEELSNKSLSGGLFKTNVEPDDKVIAYAAIIPYSKIIDLFDKLTADRTLNWIPPKGNWTILRIGHTPNGTENHPAEKGGKGLECDKMSRTALDAYWNGGVQPIVDKLRPFIGTVVKRCVIDSYEVGCNNWTESFRKEFEKRRGYDCLKYLPTLAGYYIESGEISERFLWDFRKTIGDLIADNYYGYFSELCHKNGLQSTVEPYGGPFESQKSGAAADVVMGEFWLAKQLFLESPRLAASIAHLYGKSIVGAESFTSFGSWSNYPATLKTVGDKAWAEGINHFAFHSYVHQPWNIAPGLTFGDYGVEMNRMNTWWEQSRPYFDYVARSQFLLQQGKSHADVLVFTGESVPNNGILRTDIKNRGYDYDEIASDQLMSLYVKNGKIYSTKSGPYQLLVLPETKWATPQLLTKIKSLVESGALIVGAKPQKSPSLYNYPQCDREVATIANKLWPSKIQTVFSANEIASLLSKHNILPDFEAGQKGNDLSYIHRTCGDDEIYFIANPQKMSRTEACRFRVSGKMPEIWDPETGKIMDVAVWQTIAKNITQIPISFLPKGSLFVIFKNEVPASSHRFTSFQYQLKSSSPKAIRGLKILKATYGNFLPAGVADVTAAMKRNMAKNGLHFSASSGDLGIDPAQGSVKELRFEYEVNEKHHQINLMENERKDLTEDTVGFHLIRGLYGKFASDFNQIPPVTPITDVTEKVQDLINTKNYSFTVSDSLFAVKSLVGNEPNELHLNYLAEGEEHEIIIPYGHLVSLEQEEPTPKIIRKNKENLLSTPFPGKFIYNTLSGKERILNIASVPEPITIKGDWTVLFPLKNGTSDKKVFNDLASWSSSTDDNIRYFSGTAIYKKEIDLPKNIFTPNNKLVLDLGNVKVMAEVFINGKKISTLWKAPFVIDLDNIVHAGKNSLEIHVTNLWTNNLIGDERYLNDRIEHVNGNQQWPEWLLDSSKKRGSKRTTFTTHTFLPADASLEVSGLLGPVVIRVYTERQIAAD